MPVSEWAKNLTESVLGGSPLAVGRSYLHPVDGEIEVTSGTYWGTHGLSNFWDWTVKATGEQHHGYGDAWPEVVK